MPGRGTRFFVYSSLVAVVTWVAQAPGISPARADGSPPVSESGPGSARPLTVPPKSPPAPSPVPSAGKLDGIHLVGGPLAAAHADGEQWTASYGLTLGILRLREARSLTVWGATAEVVRHEGEGGGNFWLGAVAGTTLGPLYLGVGVQTGAEFGPDHHLRPGAALLLWAHAGLAPFIRTAWNADQGGQVEFGVALPLPIRRW